ncbi:epoxide hydrolase 1 [Microthyrium microscopicum]|uniref:Epoxide hydrolase 1 n=1 Tax=Microthyrium microscopicum TaxID=703497 RepID=A0A6A6U233_9PEZI|nr:epoxide hydrolase 1 [Microthyrium microscopicum]
MSFATLPKAASDAIKPYKIAISPTKVATMELLVKSSPVGPETFENKQMERNFGLTRDKFSELKRKWVEEFKWEEQEKYLNAYPQFMAKIKDDDGREHDVHFMALFSQKADAVPISFLHGWPGSFLEFVGLFEEFKNKYDNDPSKLPYHLIAPSLPGFTLSSGPPVDRDWTEKDSARIINRLMHEIGFGSGYISQGGDIGSFVSQALAESYPECKAIHLNFLPGAPKKEVSLENISDAEKEGMQRIKDWQNTGAAYAREHGTRPSTIGLVLSSSPLALLAWIGEKFLEWTDTDPDDMETLRSVSLYWLTDSFPRCIYTYRDATAHEHKFNQPLGFSWFPKELMPVPRVWIEAKANLVWFRAHEHGGHFAALEHPKELAQDIEEFVAQVWSTGRSNL